MQKGFATKYLLLAAVFFAAFGLVMVKAETETFSATADIGNQAPVLSSFNSTSDAGKTTLVSAGSPVDEDDTIYFNVIVDDPNDDNVYIIVCNQTGLTAGNCTDSNAFICGTTSAAEGALQCSYTADSKPEGGDPATSWTATVYAYDGSLASGYNQTTTYTNHNPTVSGSISIDEATVYADGTMTVNISSASKADVDAGDTTTYYYRFLDNDDTTVLQDWSVSNTYDCSSDSGGTGNGFCHKADTIYVDLRAQDSHGAYGDGSEEAYVETTKGITNTAPTVDDVKIDGADAPTINPTEGGYTTVTITFNVSDYDRTNDANELDAGTSNATCTGVVAANTSCDYTNVDTDTDEIDCTLQMKWSTAGGGKTVTVYATDKTDGAAGSDSAHSFTYSTIYVITLNDTAISLGSFTPGTNENLGSNNQLINNTGNGNLNVTIQGAHLTYLANTWGIGNFSVDDDNIADGDGGNMANMTLTTGPQDYTPATGLDTEEQLTVWYFVDAPVGLAAGTYTSGSNWEWVSAQYS